MTAYGKLEQRFYTSGFGRFMSADRSHLNIGLNNPISWNKYSYVNGDPINAYDPTGQDCQLVSDGNGVFHLFCACVSTGGGGGGRGGDGPPVDLGTGGDPGGSYAVTTSRGAAQVLANNVKAGSITDCQALATFADFAANSESINSYFAQDFGVFFSGSDKWVQKANNVGIPIAGSSDPVTFLPPGSTIGSGFGAQYQDFDPMYPDQAHHFAAFFELGFFAGAPAGAAAAYRLDGINPSKFNAGDVQLGIYASQLGADLKAGTIKASQIGNAIRQTLCQHN
jgi:RHS repeat-associated protein